MSCLKKFAAEMKRSGVHVAILAGFVDKDGDVATLEYVHVFINACPNG